MSIEWVPLFSVVSRVRSVRLAPIGSEGDIVVPSSEKKSPKVWRRNAGELERCFGEKMNEIQ